MSIKIWNQIITAGIPVIFIFLFGLFSCGFLHIPGWSFSLYHSLSHRHFERFHQPLSIFITWHNGIHTHYKPSEPLPSWQWWKVKQRQEDHCHRVDIHPSHLEKQHQQGPGVKNTALRLHSNSICRPILSRQRVISLYKGNLLVRWSWVAWGRERVFFRDPISVDLWYPVAVCSPHRFCWQGSWVGKAPTAPGCSCNPTLTVWLRSEWEADQGLWERAFGAHNNPVCQTSEGWIVQEGAQIQLSCQRGGVLSIGNVIVVRYNAADYLLNRYVWVCMT